MANPYGGGVPGPPRGQYLGISPALGYSLGYELFGRKRDEEAQRKQYEQLRDLLTQMRPSTTQQATTTQEPTGRYQVGPEIGEPTTFQVPPSLSNALTSQLPWGTEPEGSYGPGIPPYLPEPQEFHMSPPPATPIQFGEGAGPSPIFGRAEPLPQPMLPQPLALSGRGAFQPAFAQGAPEAQPEIPLPPERPAAPPPGPAPVTGPRREPIPHIPVLGPETSPVTRMETVTKPGRELLDVIAQNPQMLEVLKAFPGLLPLIQQEQENQAFLSAVRGGQTPAVGRAPSVATGTAAVGPSAATPTAEPVAPTTEALPEQGIYDKAHARRIEMQDQADRIEANPRAAASPMGKAYLARFEKAKDQEQKAADDLRAARKEQREAAKTETPTEFGVDYARAKDELRAENPEREPTPAEIGKRVREIRAKEEKPSAPTEIGAAYALAKEQLQKELGREPTEGEVGGRVLQLREKAEKSKSLTAEVLSIIADTGIDPRTGEPASPEVQAQARASVEGKLGRAVRVAEAAGAARREVKADDPIGKDAVHFIGPDGKPPSPNMRTGDVFANYKQITPEQHKMLQTSDRLLPLFDPARVATFEPLFPSDQAWKNAAFHTQIRQGIPVPGSGLTQERIKELQPLLKQYDRFYSSAGLLARSLGEVGTLTDEDIRRVTSGLVGSSTWIQVQTTADELRQMVLSGRESVLPPRPVIPVPGGGTLRRID